MVVVAVDKDLDLHWVKHYFERVVFVDCTHHTDLDLQLEIENKFLLGN